MAAGKQLDRAKLAYPKVVFIHCGINDLLFETGSPYNWATISANLDTIRAAFPAGTEFYLDEVLPSTGKTDAQDLLIRNLNANYDTYCASNDWTLVKCHDIFGVIKASTGELDTLNPIYNCGDNLHLNLAGAEKLAEVIRSYIK